MRTEVSTPPRPVELSPLVGAGGGRVKDLPRSRRRAEGTIRALLRVPPGPPSGSDEAAYRLFSASIAVSAVRCLISYVLLPVVAPLTGHAFSRNPVLGLVLAVVALVFDVIAMRRFWLAAHPWRWKMTLVYSVVMAVILALATGDLVRLAS